MAQDFGKLSPILLYRGAQINGSNNRIAALSLTLIQRGADAPLLDAVVEGFPLRCGLALPHGQEVAAGELLARFADGSSTAVQSRPLVRWPDGSTRFLLLDWLARADDPGQQLVWQTQDGQADQANSEQLADAPPAPLLVRQEEERAVTIGTQEETWLSAQRPSDPTGRFSASWLGMPLQLDVLLQDGTQLVAFLQELQVVDPGPIRASLLLRGQLRPADPSGNQPQASRSLDWQLHLHVHAGSRSSSWQLTLRNPRPASHPGGIWELGDPAAALVRSATIRFQSPQQTNTGPPSLQFSTDLRSPWRPAAARVRISQLSSAADAKRSNNHLLAEGSFPEPPYRGYQVDADGQVEPGARATPAVLVIRNQADAIGITMPRFWQNFPLAVGADVQGLTLDLWPPECPWAMELQPGEQKTHMFHLCGGPPEQVQAMLDCWRQEPRVKVDPEWSCQSGVIPWLTPRDPGADNPGANERYLQRIDTAIEGPNNFFAKRETIDHYGWRNFGDVWGDHEAVHSDPEFPHASQYNNQYDMVLGLGLNYLRGGDARWLELMEDLARHTIDIDIYHTDGDRPMYNHGMFWHTVHYVDACKSTHRSYPRGSCGGGPSSGHAYSRGLLLHYCVTGDETARQAVIKMGDWMIDAEDGSVTRYRWLAGGDTGMTSASGSEDYHGPGRGPGNAVEVLVTAFELTHDRKYLDQAERIIRRVVHPHQDPAALDLLDAENKWFYTLFLQALGRYLEVKITWGQIDRMYAYGQRVLLRLAEWMAEHEFPYLDQPEKLEFPTETWAAQEMRKVEVFQWAARHATGESRRRYLERSEFFYRTSLDQLDGFGDRARLCRPIALLLTSGYSRDWFAGGGLERIEAAPRAGEYDFGRPRRFVSQKRRAIRNAKLLAGAMGLSVVAIAAAALWWLLVGGGGEG